MVTNKYNNITNANVNGEQIYLFPDTNISFFFKKKIVVVQFFKTIRFELKYFFKKDSIEVPRKVFKVSLSDDRLKVNNVFIYQYHHTYLS